MTITGVYNLQELKEAIARSPANWRPLVFTNGCFDLLHVVHELHDKSHTLVIARLYKISPTFRTLSENFTFQVLKPPSFHSKEGGEIPIARPL